MASPIFYVYVDFTLESVSRPFYVGKGNKSRTKHFKRNAQHSDIVKNFGQRREVILSTKDEEFAFDEEIRLIAEHKTRFEIDGHWGSNLTKGGQGSSGHKFSSDHKQKISDALKGRIKSPEACRKMSISAKTRQHHSEETLQKMSDTRKLFWKNWRLAKEQS